MKQGDSVGIAILLTGAVGGIVRRNAIGNFTATGHYPNRIGTFEHRKIKPAGFKLTKQIGFSFGHRFDAATRPKYFHWHIIDAPPGGVLNLDENVVLTPIFTRREFPDANQPIIDSRGGRRLWGGRFGGRGWGAGKWWPGGCRRFGRRGGIGRRVNQGRCLGGRGGVSRRRRIGGDGRFGGRIGRRGRGGWGIGARWGGGCRFHKRHHGHSPNQHPFILHLIDHRSGITRQGTPIAESGCQSFYNGRRDGNAAQTGK